MNKKRSNKTGGEGAGEDDEGVNRGDGGVTIEGLSRADSDGEND